MDQNWRLAFMFDAPGGDLAGLEEALSRAGDTFRRLAGEGHLRLGVADLDPSLGALRDRGDVKLRSVDGALEVTLAASRTGEIPQIAQAIGDIVEAFAEPGSIEVMTGPVFSIVPARDGGAFLSLAFRRYPGITSQAFRDWWLNQHSAIATPVLGEGLLAYDQIHVDPAASEAAARAAGVTYVEYDAYDNLTWEDRDAFLRSISNPDDMARVFADEVGHIDDPSRRNSLMRKIGP
jgi:hypothetical protein